MGSFRLNLNNRMSEHWKEWSGWHGSGQMGACWCHRESGASTSVPSALACWHMPWAWHLDEAGKKGGKHTVKLQQDSYINEGTEQNWPSGYRLRTVSKKQWDGKGTNHSSELVKLWLEVWSPEVNISSFVSHLITAERQNSTKLKIKSAEGLKLFSINTYQ